MKKSLIIGLLIVLFIAGCNNLVDEDEPSQDIKPEKIKVIIVEEVQRLPGGGSTIIQVATIFMAPEGPVASFTAVGERYYKSRIMDAIDAARAAELTLKTEEYKEIDGETVFAMSETPVEPGSPDYIYPLGDFLQDDYDYGRHDFLFLLVEADVWWSAYKNETETFGGTAPYEIPYEVKVLEFENVKGGLITSADSGAEQTTHPFLKARFLSGEEEPAIRDIMDKSESFVEFLSNLVKNGYIVMNI